MLVKLARIGTQFDFKTVVVDTSTFVDFANAIDGTTVQITTSGYHTRILLSAQLTGLCSLGDPG